MGTRGAFSVRSFAGVALVIRCAVSAEPSPPAHEDASLYAHQARRSALVSSAVLKHPRQHAAPERVDVARERSWQASESICQVFDRVRVGSFRTRGQVKLQGLLVDRAALRQDGEAFDHVSHLAHVAGPGLRDQRSYGVLLELDLAR